MELIPKALVVGVFSAPAVPGHGPDAAKLNRIWSELAPTHGFTQLQMSPEGNAANFLGSSPDHGVTIQPPLLQVRDPISLTPKQSAEQAEAILKTISRHLEIGQFFNLGIRHVYHGSLPDNDARGFLLHRVLGKTEEDLAELRTGGDYWGGVKFLFHYGEGTYALSLEPLVADMRLLFIDLDAQFPGPATVESIPKLAEEAQQYIERSVRNYLSRHQPGG